MGISLYHPVQLGGDPAGAGLRLRSPPGAARLNWMGPVSFLPSPSSGRPPSGGARAKPSRSGWEENANKMDILKQNAGRYSQSIGEVWVWASSVSCFLRAYRQVDREWFPLAPNRDQTGFCKAPEGLLKLPGASRAFQNPGEPRFWALGQHPQLTRR